MQTLTLLRWRGKLALTPMSKVLFCHDDSLFANTRGETLEKIYGHDVTVCITARDSLDRVQRGMNAFDAAIVHKDLGLGIEPIDSGDVIAAIHESATHVRIGVVSGEFPDGYTHVVKELQADFYLPTTDGKWYAEQVSKGPVLPQEIERRGRSVEMPPNS